MSKRKRQLVQIDWIDSMAAGMAWEGWIDLEPVKPAVCHSVGYLLHDGKRYKTLGMTVSPGQVLGRLTIPTASILRIRKLR